MLPQSVLSVNAVRAKAMVTPNSFIPSTVLPTSSGAPPEIRMPIEPPVMVLPLTTESLARVIAISLSLSVLPSMVPGPAAYSIWTAPES